MYYAGGNVISRVYVYQYFEEKNEEQRIPKSPKGGEEPRPAGWNSWSTKHTETEWVFHRTQSMHDKPYYIATLSSCVDANMLGYQQEVRYGGEFVGPKAASPRQAVMALMDSLALADKSAKS